jgi:hypothetical protein
MPLIILKTPSLTPSLVVLHVSEGILPHLSSNTLSQIRQYAPDSNKEEELRILTHLKFTLDGFAAGSTLSFIIDPYTNKDNQIDTVLHMVAVPREKLA